MKRNGDGHLEAPAGRLQKQNGAPRSRVGEAPAGVAEADAVFMATTRGREAVPAVPHFKFQLSALSEDVMSMRPGRARGAMP